MKKFLSLILVLAFASVASADLKNRQDMRGGFKVGANGVTVKQIRCGTTAAMVAGTTTVSDTTVTANSIILLSGADNGGTGGSLRVTARTPGTSFVITSSSGTDTGKVAYCIFEP